MEPETLIFMPNGDVTLTLVRNILEEDDPETSIEDEQPSSSAPIVDAEAPPEPEEPEEDVLFYAPDAPDSETFYPPTRRTARGSDASSRRDRSSSPPASFWASLKRQKAQMGETSVGENPTTETKPAKKQRAVLSSHEVHCIVSSRHMMLASQYFESLLSGESNEGTTLRSKSHVSISLSADLDAMVILLNIVHGVSRKVPRQVKLETLRKLATLVSAFGMIDTVQFFSDTWIDDFQRKGLPKTYDEKVLPLLFVFWVFDRPAEFKNMSRIAQRECDENLAEDAHEIPLPNSIIDAIKRDREFAMESAIAVIHTLINKYLDGKTICDGAWEEELAYACDATVLGSLMKSSRKIGIWPKPEAPFPGRKFKDLAHAIRSIRVLDVCKKSSSRRLHLLGPSNNSHGLEDSIEAAMKGIESGMDGLELVDYPKKSFILENILPTPPKDTEEVQSVDVNGEFDDQAIEPIEEDYHLYMKEDVEAPRREYSLSPPAYSARSNFKSVDELAQPETEIAPSHYSRDFSKQESPVFEGVSIRDLREPFHHNGNAISRDPWNQESKEPVNELEKANSRDYRTEEAREYINGHRKPVPRNSWNQELKEPVYELEKENSRDSRSEEAREYINGQRKAVPRNSWNQEPKEPVHEQTRADLRGSRSPDKTDPAAEQAKITPRDSWHQEVREPVHVQARALPRDSWAQEAKDPVIEQRKMSPRDSWSQGTRTPSTMTAKSPVETASLEVKAPTAWRPNPNTSFFRDDVKPAVHESQPTSRNSSTERVKALADRSLHRTPSFHKITNEDGKSRPQQPAVAPKVASTEEARVLTERKPNSTPSYLRDEVKHSVQQPQMASRTSSTEEVQVLADKRSTLTNSFTNSNAKSSLQQPPVASRASSTEEVINGDRRPNTSNPSTKTPNNGVNLTPPQPSAASRVPSREEVAALTNKKLNKTSLFPDTAKDNSKPPMVPRVASIEDATKIKDVSRPEKAEVKPSAVEVKTPSSDALMTTEDEGTVIAPQKFNMRKSKKKFQAKY